MSYLRRHFFIFVVLLSIFPGVLAQTSVIDIEGNRYRTIKIGNQEWMAENLRTTKFNDGTAIPNITDKKEWVRINTPGYSWYDNDSSSKSVYGGLYNFQTVSTEKLCPKGWYIPTDEDWTILFDISNDSDSMVLHELEKAGFSVVPGGYRYGYYWGSGNYHEKGENGYWWTSTPCTDTHIWTHTISVKNQKFYRSYFEKNNGFSVRCIRNTVN